MELWKVAKKLDQFAPASLAGSWDNVGLLVEPELDQGVGQGAPARFKVHRLAVANDLTEAVMQECLDKKVDMIVAYHPPIFRPLKRLTSASWKERIIIRCLANNIALYSPHTALDAIQGGVNDWLIAPFLTGRVSGADVRPLEPGPANPEVGAGRFVTLEEPIALQGAVERVKAHLNLGHLRLAAPSRGSGADFQVGTVSVCAGSGSSVLRAPSAPKADLWVTGELSHHEVLDAVHEGTAVILCEHSNTERGFLRSTLVPQLTALLEDQVEVFACLMDEEPLKVV